MRTRRPAATNRCRTALLLSCCPQVQQAESAHCSADAAWVYWALLILLLVEGVMLTAACCLLLGARVRGHGSAAEWV